MKINTSAINLKLATQYFEAGNYEKTLSFLYKFQGRQRSQFKPQEFESHYRLGLKYCAENQFSRAHKHFSEAVQLASTPGDIRLCQARLATLKKLIINPSPPLPDSIQGRKHNCPGCTDDKTFYDCAVCDYIQAVHKSKRLDVNALQPQVNAAFAVGAYKSWWDRYSTNPYSQAIKQARNPQSTVLLEPLGILLADFIANTQAGTLREHVDFICPVPTEATNPNSWRYRALEIIGGVISRRFGIPLFSVLESTGPQRNTRKQCHQSPHLPFAVTDPALIANRHVLLLDDLTTYQKTIKQAATALKIVGAKQVSAVILAYTEPTRN